MMEYFRAHQAVGTTIPTYFIESTAPNNVDDLAPVEPALPPELKPLPADIAIHEIAQALAAWDNPNLVVMVHGFNNPEPDVLATYIAAARAIEADPAIRNRPGLVCIGYRWPSEKMGQPIRGTWRALPTLPTWILYFGAALVLLSFPLFYWGTGLRERLAAWLGYIWNPAGVHVVTMLGWTVAGLVLTAALLRTIVYFRDTYRATNYGVPDLIHVIRAIDSEVLRLGGPGGAGRRIELSFIGHSMGGYVVTNAIRTLSDVFATKTKALNLFGAQAVAEGASEPPSPEIGHVFRLMRFVLASPDIPAETLLSSRGNFLASALLRFREAYLFSNEGDEVLRQISTLANYFVFPTKSRNHGFRLGNVEILSRQFGLIRVGTQDFLRALRIGNRTLQQLHDALEQAAAQRLGRSVKAVQMPPVLPKVFSYFDCTDYVDRARDGCAPRPLLTFAKCRKRADATARLRWYSHLHLLWAYVVRQKPNVHGGYFEGQLSQQLIYRLACLGYDGTVAAYGSEGALSAACAAKQIRVLVSPGLQPKPALAAPAMRNVPAIMMADAAARHRAPEIMAEPPAARAPASGVVPEVVGLTAGAARAAIAAALGAEAPPVLEIAERATAAPGTVLRQIPNAGSAAPLGVPVELVVAAE